jgi:hypothetical protein
MSRVSQIYIFACFLLQVMVPCMAQEEISVLVTKLDNVTGNRNDDFIAVAVYDAVIASLNQVEGFVPREAADNAPDISDATELARYAFNKNHDVFIKGYYFIEGSSIAFNFRVVDVLTGRIRVRYDNSGSTGVEIYSLIRESVAVLVEDMTRTIKPYPKDDYAVARRTRAKKLFRQEMELGFLVDAGITFVAAPNIPLVPVSAQYNNNYHRFSFSLAPYIHLAMLFETAGKKHYAGFGVSFDFPAFVFANTWYMQSLDFNLSGYFMINKRLLLGWSLAMMMDVTYLKEVEHKVFALGTGFSMGWSPYNRKHAITGGLLFFPPVVPPAPITESYTQWNPVPNYFKVNYISSGEFDLFNYSMLIPVKLVVDYHSYPVNRLGINIRNEIWFIYLDMNDTNINWGRSLTVNISTSVGFSFRNLNRVTLARQ